MLSYSLAFTPSFSQLILHSLPQVRGDTKTINQMSKQEFQVCISVEETERILCGFWRTPNENMPNLPTSITKNLLG